MTDQLTSNERTKPEIPHVNSTHPGHDAAWASYWQDKSRWQEQEIERLNRKCGALAYLQYGSSGPDDPWQAKLDAATKPLHADIEHLTLALVQQEGTLNECEALLRETISEDGVYADFDSRLAAYWEKSKALADWRTRDMLIAARHSSETREQHWLRKYARHLESCPCTQFANVNDPTMCTCGFAKGPPAQKALEHPPGDCNRRELPGDPCDRNCNWPECGCIYGDDGVMRPTLSERE